MQLHQKAKYPQSCKIAKIFEPVRDAILMFFMIEKGYILNIVYFITQRAVFNHLGVALP